jgi:hypothetical protein
MLISQPALLCLEATWRRVFRLSNTDADGSQSHALIPLGPEAGVIARIDMAVVAPDEGSDAAPTSISQTDLADSTIKTPQPELPLTANERRARAAALHALALCRGRRFDAARAAFGEAARLDPALDLTRTPAFWKLERAAHEAAIDAYVEAGRDGDAAILRARVRSTYRPKAIRARPGPILSS